MAPVARAQIAQLMNVSALGEPNSETRACLPLRVPSHQVSVSEWADTAEEGQDLGLQEAQLA